MIREKRIRDGFVQYHFNAEHEEPWPVFPVLHHIWTPDAPEPHDHPHDITCWVRQGSYLAQVWGPWKGQLIHTHNERREAGDVFTIHAEQVQHRIFEVSDYWAMCFYGPTRRDWRMYPELV